MISPPNCPASPLFSEISSLKLANTNEWWCVNGNNPYHFTAILTSLSLVINQQSNSFTMLCDESTWNKSVELYSNRTMICRRTSAICILIIYLSTISRWDCSRWEKKTWNWNRCRREHCENNFLMNFEFHHLNIIEFPSTFLSLKLMTDFSVMISSTHLPRVSALHTRS